MSAHRPRCRGAGGGISTSFSPSPSSRAELTVAVLGDRALAVTELKPETGFYDYDSKHTDGLTVHVCPAEIPQEIAAAAMDMALKAHRVLEMPGHQPLRLPLGRRKGLDGYSICWR